MRGAAFVAIAASIGNFLQGWDNATIAGTSFFHIYICYLLISSQHHGVSMLPTINI